MRILLFGANGQIGWELKDRLAPIGEVLALTRIGLNGYIGDLSDLKGISSTILKFRPDVVFNAAAYTSVEQAEEDRDLVMLVNADAPGVMAKACKECNSLLVHYSTDYVYNGVGSKPWLESDTIDPLNFYGRSKALGDARICNTGVRHLVFRTSWAYGLYGDNFVKQMLKVANRQKSISVVNDQFGTPTSASFIAQTSIVVALNCLSRRVAEGVYHLVPDGFVNWSNFARIIFKYLQQVQGIEPVEVKDILTAEYQARAIRPLNSRMNNQKLKSVLPRGCIKDWEYYLKRDLAVLVQRR